MKTYSLRVSTPDGTVFEKQVQMFSVRGLCGDLAVMANHIPLITATRPCTARVYGEDGTCRTAHAEGGLLSVSSDRVNFLTDSFQWEEN